MLKKAGRFISSHVLTLSYMLPVFITIFGAGLVALRVLERSSSTSILVLCLSLLFLLLLGYRKFHVIVKRHASPATFLLPVLLIALGFWSFWNINYTSQHVFTDRDPATYLLTSAYFQDSSGLTFNVPNEVQDIKGVTAESPGFSYLNDTNDELTGQGMHMLPALGAVAGKSLGELRMNSINVIIGAIALLSFFGFIRLYIADKWAFVATTVLGMSLPFLYFSRDFYSEILSTLILFGFLSVAYFAHKSRSLVLWAVAGMCLGSLVLVRIDGFLVMAAVFFVLLTSTAQPKRIAKKHARNSALIAIPTALLIASIGLFDIFVFNPNYYAGENRDSLMMNQFFLLGGLTIAGFIFAHLGRFKHFYSYIESPHFRRIILVLLSLFFVVTLTRPMWLTTYGSRENKFVETIQEAGEHTIEPTRTYNEYSAEWMGWYIGTPIVYVGLFVAIWLFATYFRKGYIDNFPLVLFCIIILLTAGVYLLRPNVSPDQIWAVRRFLPVVMPGLIFCTMFALQFVEKQFRRRVRPHVIFSFAAALAIIPSLLISSPFFTVGEYQRMGGFVKVCQVLPKDSVVLWLSQAGNELLMATNTYCDIPAIAFKDKTVLDVPTRQELKQVQNALAKKNKKLYVGYLDSFYGKLETSIQEENARTVAQYDYYELERTLYGPPRQARLFEQKIFLGKINSEGSFQK